MFRFSYHKRGGSKVELSYSIFKKISKRFGHARLVDMFNNWFIYV